MPVTIKSAAMKYKDASGAYVGIDAISETTTSEQVAAITAAGAAQQTAIEAKGAETRDSIPDDYTALSDEVDSLRSAIDNNVFEHIAPTMIDGSYINAVGTIGQNASFALSDYIKIDNVHAVYSAMASGYAIYYFDAHKIKLSAQDVSNQAFESQIVILNPPQNAAYFRFNDYKPTLNSAECYILLSVPNKNGDEITKTQNSVDAFRNASGVPLVLTWENGAFINSTTGNTGASDNYKATSYINISEYEKLYVNAFTYLNAIGLAFYDEANNYISGVGLIDNEFWSITIPDGAYYVRVSTSIEIDGVVVGFKKDIIDDSHFKYFYSFEFEDATYINRTNGNTVTMNGNSASGFVELYRGAEKLIITSANAINEVIGGAFYNANKEFVSGIVLYNTANILETKTFNVPKAARYFRITNLTGSKQFASAYSPITFKTEINNNDYVQLIPYVSAKIIAVGDSLTAGDFYPKGTNVSAGDTQKNYPYFLSRILNVPITNAGKSGATPLSWWAEVYPTINFANHDTMILWLGTNAGLTDTLETDVDPFSDYNDYAATNTGTYCKIIEAFISESNGGKVFLVTVGNSVTDAVIAKIATKYNLPVIDITYLLRSYSPEYFNTNVVHRNTYGNLMVADYVRQQMGEWWKNHIELMDFCFHTKENPLT